MQQLPGAASDDFPAICAVGGSNIDSLFMSMSERHPDGDDAGYLYWHTFDHRPEQYRIETIRASQRLVSTPECRRARIVAADPYDRVDHVMTYFFTDRAGLADFSVLSHALGDAGRKPYLLPAVDRGFYRLDGMAASPRVKVSSAVLPWWPATGVFLLLERGFAGEAGSGIPGVAGVWWAAGLTIDVPGSNVDGAGLHLSYLFLDEDPPTVAAALRGHLERRWGQAGVEPLFAAPFHVLDPRHYRAHLP